MPVERGTLRFYEFARTRSPQRVLDALKELNTIRRTVGPFFDDHDVWMSPTCAQVAQPQGEFSMDIDLPPEEFLYREQRPCQYLVLYNATGQPAISLPLAEGSNGLPIGVHTAPDPGEEHILIALAAALEQGPTVEGPHACSARIAAAPRNPDGRRRQLTTAVWRPAACPRLSPRKLMNASASERATIRGKYPFKGGTIRDAWQAGRPIGAVTGGIRPRGREGIAPTTVPIEECRSRARNDGQRPRSWMYSKMSPRTSPTYWPATSGVAFGERFCKGEFGLEMAFGVRSDLGDSDTANFCAPLDRPGPRREMVAPFVLQFHDFEVVVNDGGLHYVEGLVFVLVREGVQMPQRVALRSVPVFVRLDRQDEPTSVAREREQGSCARGGAPTLFPAPLTLLLQKRLRCLKMGKVARVLRNRAHAHS